MFELSNEAVRDLIETAKEIEAQNEVNENIAKNGEFVANNWIKESVENNTLNEIKERGGAVWLSPDGDIVFRPSQLVKPIKIEKVKAQNVLANFLDRESIRLLNGTKEVQPDIFPNDLLCATDKFTPFSKSEFFEIDGVTYRTPWRPTLYMNANTVGDFPTITMLLQRLTGHKVEYYQWVVNWIAGFFQSRRRSQCALVLKGDQGSGKGIFFEHIIKPLFGIDYCIMIDDDRLHATFKNWIYGSLFYNLNEISHDIRTRKAVKNFIKQLVTDPLLQAEQKYKDSSGVEVFGAVLVTSNELAPLEIETSDRRYTVIQTDKGLKKDGIDTDRLIQSISRELNPFAAFLLSYRVDWNLFNTALDTPEKRAVVNTTTDKVVLLGHAIKTMDIEFFEPLAEINNHLFCIIYNDFQKSRFCQSFLRQLYEQIFDDTVTARYLISRLAAFDVSIFGDTKKSNGRKYYMLKLI